MTAEPAPDGARRPARPDEQLPGGEMDVPYPFRALATSFLTLAAVPAAAGCSRHLVRLALNRWGLARMTGDAELVMSELATNAVQATGLVDPDAKWGDLGNLAVIHVRLLLFDTSIVIEVWDRDRAAPAPQDVTADEEGGRGLLIVTALSTGWGCFLPPQGGKAVWAELALPEHPVAASGLPRRTGVLAGPCRVASLFERDPGLLARVHRGLRDL
jgi:anti-sigma regulatory factor (Ser/Thr protein kinase)